MGLQNQFDIIIIGTGAGGGTLAIDYCIVVISGRVL